MTENTRTSKRTLAFSFWLLITVIFPFAPPVMEGLIRFVVAQLSLNARTFNGASLALTSGLLLFFVSLALQNQAYPLDDTDERAKRKVWYAISLMLTFFCLTLYICITLLDALAEFRTPAFAQIAKELIEDWFGPVAFVSPVFVVIYSWIMQFGFNLEVGG